MSEECALPLPRRGCVGWARNSRSSPSIPTRTRPIFAIASMPRCGRDPCAARPIVSISKQTKPRCATASCISVGSVTIAASARVLAATASVPTLANSSSATAVSTTCPRRPRLAASAVASMQAARLPFMSYEPRPYRRPPSRRPTNGSVIPATPTVSVCALRISVRPPPLPRATATTFGLPGAGSVRDVSRPARSHHSATKRATSASPEPPGTTSGLIDSMATSCAANSATSLTR
jgi:hypothetical protein